MQGKVLELPGRQWRFECHAMWRLRTRRRLERIRKVVARQKRSSSSSHSSSPCVRIPCVRVQWCDWSEKGQRDIQRIVETLRLCTIEEIVINVRSTTDPSAREGKVGVMEQLVQLPTHRLTLPENWKNGLDRRHVQRIMSRLQQSTHYHDLMITHWGTDMEVLKVFCHSKLRGSLVLHIGEDILDQFVYLLKYGRLVSLRLTINRQFVDYGNAHLREEFEDALASNTTLETLEIGVRYPQESHTVIRSVLVALTKNRTVKRLEVDNPFTDVECWIDALPHMHGVQELVAPWPVVSHDVGDEDATDYYQQRLVTALKRNTSLTRWDTARHNEHCRVHRIPSSVQSILRRNTFMKRVRDLKRFTEADDDKGDHGDNGGDDKSGGGGDDSRCGELLPWLAYCRGDEGLSARYMLLGKYFTAQLE